MKIKWLRGNSYISFRRPDLWFVQGIRDSGKSSLLEHLAEIHLSKGHTVWDMYASRDGENLAWLRSPWAEKKRILLIRGQGVDVDCGFPSKLVDQVSLADFERYDIIISSPPLFLNMDQEFFELGRLTDKLYRRLEWKKLTYVIMREAANFLYSRMKLIADQNEAKTQAVYMLREGRHCGISFGLDSVRLLSIDVNVRSIADYMILKSQGHQALQREYRWLFRYFQPYSIMHMPQNCFCIITKKGCVGYGVFKYPKWHKQERENILKAVGIKIEYGEPVREGKYRGKFKTIGDEEHAEIIRLYLDGGLSMARIAEELNRSTASIKMHIDRHNESIEKMGYCPACRRVKSSLEGEKAVR